MTYNLIPIGEILTPYNEISECPMNVSEDGPECEIVLYDDYKIGLYGIKENDLIDIMYWLDVKDRVCRISKSRYSGKVVGTFAKRTPNRPNPIGLSTLTVRKVTDNSIFVNGLDCLNKTKLIDIKPAIRRKL